MTTGQGDNKLLSFLGWTFGIILGIIGFTGTLTQGLEGLGLLFSSFLFIPPIVGYIKKKSGVRIGIGIRIATLFASLLLIGLVGTHRNGTLTRELEEATAVAEHSNQATEVSTVVEAMPALSQDDYWIKASASPIGERMFEVEIEANIPGSYQLATSLALQDQEPDDIFIGTEFQRVPVSGGVATAVVDGTLMTFPSNSTLPAGDYWIKICFHPLWSENNSIAEECNISTTIEIRIPVTIGAASDDICTSGHYLNSSEKEYLSSKYYDLIGFVGTAEFAQYGFGSGGPYNGWLIDLESWEQDNPSFWGGIIAREIIQLGMAYVFENESNINYFNECIPEELENYSE